MKEEKYAIIAGDIHKLVKIKDKNCDYAWFIHYEKDLYWVPIKNSAPKEFEKVKYFCGMNGRITEIECCYLCRTPFSRFAKKYLR